MVARFINHSCALHVSLFLYTAPPSTGATGKASKSWCTFYQQSLYMATQQLLKGGRDVGYRCHHLQKASPRENKIGLQLQGSCTTALHTAVCTDEAEPTKRPQNSPNLPGDQTVVVREGGMHTWHAFIITVCLPLIVVIILPVIIVIISCRAGTERYNIRDRGHTTDTLTHIICLQ